MDPNVSYDGETRGGESGAAQERTARSIGPGVQVLLVCAGIVLFAAGLTLSFGGFGFADLGGGVDDEAVPGGDDPTDNETAEPDDDDPDASEDADDEDSTEDGTEEDATDGGESDGEEEEDDGGSLFEEVFGDEDEESSDEDGTTDDGSTDDGSTDDGSTDNESTDDGSTDDGSVAVETEGATGIDASSGTLNGQLTDLGGADSAEVYFEWRAVGEDSWNRTSTQDLSGTDTFSESVSGLESDTEYEFRAVAEASDGDRDTGGTMQFTTDSDDQSDDEESGELTIETHDADDVDSSNATLNGELTDLGGNDSALVYFEWRRVGEESWNSTGSDRVFSTGSFSEELTDLESDTEYEFRAVAEASDGSVVVGETVRFTTDSDGFL